MIYVMPKKTMWKELEDALTAELEFKDFAEAFAFMTDVAALAEEHDHHPEWSNVYNEVTIRLTTHDAGNQVTDKDHKMAGAIEALASVEGAIKHVGGKDEAGEYKAGTPSETFDPLGEKAKTAQTFKEAVE